MTIFELSFSLACKCAGCGREVDDWERRVEGAERYLSAQTDDSTTHAVEVAEHQPGCAQCGGRRVLLRFGLDDASDESSER